MSQQFFKESVTTTLPNRTFSGMLMDTFLYLCILYLWSIIGRQAGQLRRGLVLSQFLFIMYKKKFCLEGGLAIYHPSTKQKWKYHNSRPLLELSSKFLKFLIPPFKKMLCLLLSIIRKSWKFYVFCFISDPSFPFRPSRKD